MSEAPFRPPAPPAWNRVKWTEAGQIAAQLDDVAIPPEDATAAPRDWWAAQVAAGELGLAIRFLAMALPRLEAVAWAAQAVERAKVRGDADRAAMAAVSRWIAAPDDALRRAAWAHCEPIDGPIRFLGAALFFSGGSIAPADLEAVHPAPTLCGTAAAGAVLAAAHRSTDPHAALAEALAAGDRIAAGAE